MKEIDNIIKHLEEILNESQEKYRELIVEENSAAYRKVKILEEMNAIESLIASYKEKVL